MNGELQTNLRRLGLRLLCAVPFLALGLYLLLSALGGALGLAFYGAAALIVGGMIIAFPVAELLARPLMSLYFPTQSGPAPANHSIPEARVKQGRYADAIAAYEKILTTHPAELRAHIGLIEIAFRHLGDRDRANQFYVRANAALKDPAAQARLHRAYTAQRDWFENPPR